jgi:hypothetical protein
MSLALRRAILSLASRHDAHRAIRHRPLEFERHRRRRRELGLDLLGLRQNDRHCLRANRRDEGVRLSRQEREEVVRRRALAVRQCRAGADGVDESLREASACCNNARTSAMLSAAMALGSR